MVMKIENFEGTADTFTFPYNPQSFDNTLEANSNSTPVQYHRHNYLVSGAGLNPISITMTGHFSGPDRWTHYRDLAKHFIQNDRLKKLFFEDDKFYLGAGKRLKKTHASGRTNFIDYVFSFNTLLGTLFSDTVKTSGTNDGTTQTYIFEITGNVDNGSEDVILEDSKGNKVKIHNSAFTSGSNFKYELVKMIDSGSGISISEYGIVSINDTQTKQVSTETGFGLLLLDSGDDVDTNITISNLTSTTVSFRDAYAD